MSQDDFTVKYIIPDDLRDYHIDGASVSATPARNINLHFFSERRPIPKTAVHEFDEKGNVLKDPKMIYGCEIVRLIQTSIVIELDTAKAIVNVLQKTIKELEGKTDG